VSDAGLLRKQWKIKRRERGRGGKRLAGVDCIYHFGRDPHAFEPLLVIRSGLGAVIRNENDLFAWRGLWSDVGNVEVLAHSIPLLRSISRVSTVPSNRWSPDHRTPILVLYSAILPYFIHTDSLVLFWHLQHIHIKGAHHHSRTETPRVRMVRDMALW